MYKKDFCFDLPKNLIAQTPQKSRDRSRLLCMAREQTAAEGAPEALDHRYFYELPSLLRPGDCLVLNDSRVLPARLIGTRDTGGAVEALLLRPSIGSGSTAYGRQTWECLLRPSRKVRQGAMLSFGNGMLTATVKGKSETGNRMIEFRYDGVFLEVLEELGKMPLPPYIHEELQDAERYQTVYSRKLGSVAAPTAGLHFTHKLLDELRLLGVGVCHITLHVGLGTFRPVKTEIVEDHVMHSEYFRVPRETAQLINSTKEKGGRVIAVGTTTCRALESAADAKAPSHSRTLVNAAHGQTAIFIYPGYEFKCVDGLITNFHLPGSTLIMLVSAFAGRERILAAYEEARENKYRFFSFGDAMLIL